MMNFEMNEKLIEEKESTVYLIDYENVSYRGLYGISNIQPTDEIVIFYSKDISIIRDIIGIYEKIGIKLSFYQLEETGKNALDFMISVYAGYISSKDNVKKIVIISNDKGYGSIVSMINSLNPSVEIAFDCCIHNVIFPEDKKEITFIIQSCKNKEIESLKKECEAPKECVKVENKSVITKESVQIYLTGRIPNNYVGTTTSKIVKSISNNDTEKAFAKEVERIFGKKSTNTPYKNQVKEYYKSLLKVK